MTRLLEVSGYGFHMYSMDSLLQYRKKTKIRTKKMLDLFQKDNEKYLDILNNKVWLAFPDINSISYSIKFAHLNEDFNDEWEKKFTSNGYQIKIGADNSFWIETIDTFDSWDKSEHENVLKISYITFDGEELTNAYKISIDEGFYFVEISGFKKHNNDEFGYLITLKKSDKTCEIKDPRLNNFRF